MPAAGVVDRGEQSRDGYDAVVDALRSGRTRTAVRDRPRRRRAAGRRPRRGRPGVVAATVVAEPAASGRAVVRVTPSTAVDSEATSQLVHRLRAQLGDEVPGARLGRPGKPEHRPDRRADGHAPRWRSP